MKKNIYQPNQFSQGYSLIELVIAIAIIGTSLISLFLGYSISSKTYLKAKRESIAYHCLEKEMEVVRNTPYSSLPNPPYSQSFWGNLTCLNQLSQSHGTIAITWYDPPKNQIKKIDLELTWQEAGMQKKLNLSTLSTIGGING
jgi:prepilin-type N-terminal cleavage/methylation domain-containing protein